MLCCALECLEGGKKSVFKADQPGNSGTDHHIGISGSDPGGGAAADAALCHPGRAGRTVSGRAVHLYFGHLCDRAGGARHLHLLVGVRPAGDSGADPGGRHGRGDRGGGRGAAVRQAHRPAPAVCDAGVHLCAAGGRHCAHDGLHFKDHVSH